jgi:hypothetical protein
MGVSEVFPKKKEKKSMTSPTTEVALFYFIRRESIVRIMMFVLHVKKVKDAIMSVYGH